MHFAVISSCAPTESQRKLAEEMGHDLEWIGDANGFTVSWEFVRSKGPFNGVVVNHPAAALRLTRVGFAVGVFEHANKNAPGEKPEFQATALHIYEFKGVKL